MNRTDRQPILAEATRVMKAEAEAIVRTADGLEESFCRVVDALFLSDGNVLLTGVGKSGIAARKIAATLNSIGRPSLFLNPLDALHGDLGVARADDLALFFSKSGQSEELVTLSSALGTRGVRQFLVSGSATGPIADRSEAVIRIDVDREACPLDLAPTASTAAMVAVGDALAMSVAKRSGFTADDFAERHPAGTLGRRLTLRLEAIMVGGGDIPIVNRETPFLDLLVEMSEKRLGCALVLDQERLVGIVTDGDVRRGLIKGTPDRLCAQDLMSKDPMTASILTLAADALEQLESTRRTHLPVVDDEHRIVGIVHIHHLIEAGL